MNRLKDKIRDMTDRARFVDNPKDKVVALNAVLRGWINYYRHCNAKQVAGDLDHWVHLRVARWLVHRHKSNYREVLQQYLKQEGNRKNFAVQQTDGSDLFLVLMRDLPLTPYRRRACQNPYLQENLQPTVLTPEIPLPDEVWKGQGAQAEWHNTRTDVLARDGYCCQDCGSRENLDVHHLVPRHKGGQSIPDNLMTLCEPCHVARGNYGRPRKGT